MKLPPPTAIAPMRRLAHELAAAHGALSVGLAVAIEPVKPLDLRIQRDATLLEPTLTQQPLEVEADAALEIGIADVATIRIRGGRRDARERVHVLEQTMGSGCGARILRRLPFQTSMVSTPKSLRA